MGRFPLYFALLLLCGGVVCAQRRPLQHYGHEEGLSNLAVFDIAQDYVGFLWVATENGMFRFDGVRFEEYGVAQGLPHSYVVDLCVDQGGKLWAAAVNGVAWWNGKRFERIALPGNPDLSPGTVLNCATGGKVFVSTSLGVMEIVSGGARVRKLPGPRDAGIQKAYGVKQAPDGRVWYGCGNKLCIYHPDTDKTTSPVKRLAFPRDQWDSVVHDRAGHVWVRSRTQMLEIDPVKFVWWRRDKGLPVSARVGAARLLNGRIAVATDEGLAWWRNGEWEIDDERRGLRSNMVSTAYRDREGSIWYGYAGSGLSRVLGRGAWAHWGKEDGLPSSVIWGIERDKRGNLWVATNGGLAKQRDDGGWEVWNESRGLPGTRARAVAAVEDGSVWVGYSPGGVVRIDPGGGVRAYGTDDGLSADAVMAAEADRERNVWVATRRGLFRSRAPGYVRFEEVQVPGFAASDRYVGLMRDSDGALWVGGLHGLAVLRGREWRRYSKSDGLLSDFVGSIGQAKDGGYWIGYRENVGLTEMRLGADGTPTLRHFRAGEAFGSGLSMFVGADARGWIWRGSDRGADVWDGSRWRHYSHADGLVWNDTDGNSFWADGDGTVWIGTSQGLSRYRRVEGPVARPRVVIQRVRVGSQTREGVPEKLAFAEQPFEVEYAALTFQNARKVRFQYRLSGWTRGIWEETEERHLRYPQLPPGKYKFEVVARNGVGEWSARAAEFEFTVLPVWWKGGWFLSLLSAAVAGLIVWGHRWRLRSLLEAGSKLERAVVERTRELQEANRAKSEFLAHMSHEIRTPLNGIVGITQLLRDTRLDEEARELVELSHASSQTLVQILNGILDFSKLEAGKMELETAPLAPREVARESAATLATLAREKGLSLTWDVGADVPERVLGDATRLRQVLLNLLANAVKFTSAGAVWLRVERKGDALVFEVGDTGPGIAEEKRALIFDAFTQADSSMTRRFGGTGLGLAISRKLVFLMGGRIEVESEVGRGSLFRCVLPLVEAGAVAEAVRVERTDVGRRALRILVAEDNPVNQLLARKLLERSGHEVHVVGDGLEAVEAAGESDFDLALMDVQMPELDGYEATRRIRKRGSSLPIYALTANAMEGDRERCLECGMDGYLSKPLSVEALGALLDGVERGVCLDAGYFDATQARKSPSGSTSSQ